MAYITREEVQVIRKELKAAFPKVKFSITLRHSSSLHIVILKASYDVNFPAGQDYTGMNISRLDECRDHPKATLDAARKMKAIANKTNFDESNIQEDYFHVGFYLHISFGDWERPYQKIA